MRFFLFGPRVFGFRPGVSISTKELTRQRCRNEIDGAFVYVVRGDHNLTKIGVTTNPRARLAQLKTGSGFPINFAFIGAPSGDAYAVEVAAHAALARNQVNGE